MRGIDASYNATNTLFLFLSLYNNLVFIIMFLPILYLFEKKNIIIILGKFLKLRAITHDNSRQENKVNYHCDLKYVNFSMYIFYCVFP